MQSIENILNFFKPYSRAYDSDTESIQSESSSSSFLSNTNQANKNLIRIKFFAYHSRNFWQKTLKVVESLKQKYSPDVLICLANSNAADKSRRVFEILSTDSKKANQCFCDLKSQTNVISKKIDLKNDEIEQIIQLKNEIVSLKPPSCKEFINFHLREKDKCYVVEYFDAKNDDYRLEFDTYLENINKLLDEKVEKTQEFPLDDPSYSKFFEKYFSDLDDVKIAIGNQNIKVRTTKGGLEKFKHIYKCLNKIDTKVDITNKRVIPYIIFKLKDFAKDFDSECMFLKYLPLETNSKFLEFSIISINKVEAEKEIENIKNFIKNAKVSTVLFNDAEKAKAIELACNKKNDCYVKYNVEYKKFFINGLDETKINFIKDFIVQNI